MSIRIKIILIFTLTSMLIVGGSSSISYFLMKGTLINELKGRIKDLAISGVNSLDISAYRKLVEKASADLSPEEISKAESSQEYIRIYNELNEIRKIEPDLIRYVYLLIPDGRPGVSRFVVDADVLTLVEEERKTGDTSEEISHFSKEYDISSDEMKYLRSALEEKIVMVEEEMTYDEEYNINAISAYAPVFDENQNYLGILGLDMSDKNIRNALRQSSYYSLIIGIASVLIAMIASFLAGSSVTSGILELTNITRRFAEKNFEARAKIATNDEIGQLASSFNLMAQTIQDYAAYLERLIRSYGNFVPHSFLKLLGKETIVDVKLGDQVQQEMSILFSDIRSFTTLSESMTPRENFNFINAYLSRVGPVIRDNHGIIDKYIGDAVMALFPTCADDALKSAIQMQRKVREYNIERHRAGYQALAIGVGIHTGMLMLGTVGEEERMNGTVISDAVNLASRLEGATKYYKSGIIISEDTLKKLGQKELYYIRFLDKIKVKGKNGLVSTYEVFNGDTQEQIAMKEKIQPILDEAYQLYFRRNFQEALIRFDEAGKISPSDQIPVIFRERCVFYIENGIPDNWDGSFEMRTK